jgi:hypothetical protein
VIKSTLNHINILNINLRDLENTIANLKISTDKKYKEETKSLKQTLDGKFKKNKKEIQKILNETENKIDTIFKGYEEQLQKLNLQKKNRDNLKEQKSLVEGFITT